MTTRSKTLAHLLFAAALFVCAATALAQEGQTQAPRVDKRKLTTIQTAAIDAGATKNAVEVRYLNLPWGEATFGYIETGIDPRNNGYYSGRAWPIAHLTLAAPATFEGKPLAPGDYAIIITPANPKENKGMMLALASFKPTEAGGTFLQAGNVFAEAPKDATVVVTTPIKFDKGAPPVDHLVIETQRMGQSVALNFHYGDRTLVEKLTLK